MPAANQCQIILGTTAMTIEREPIASNVPEVIPYSQIVSVVPITFQQQPSGVDAVHWKYRFPTMTEICINLSNGEIIYVELQEVTNQPTWNLGTQAAQQTAVAAIQAVIP